MDQKPTLLDEWVAQKIETPIETHLELIDPHHFMLDVASQPRGFLTELFYYRYAFLPRRLCCQSRRAYKYILRHKLLQKPETRAWLNTLGGLMECRGPSNTERYMLEEMHRDMDGNNVVKSVSVEGGWEAQGIPYALQPIGETEMNRDCAWHDPRGRPNAFIARADLSLGKEVETTLRLHKKYGNVRGIQHSIAYHHDHGLVVNLGKGYEYSKSEAFREAFALLHKFDFSYNTCCYHVNIPALTDLARSFPDTTIICNHIGTPLGIGPFAPVGSSWEAWKDSMKDLSECPNVYVKLSGLGLPGCGFKFNERSTPPGSDELAKTFGPYYTLCIELFGFSRCMFASNFPLDKISGSYTAHWNCFKKICNAAGYTEDQKKQLMYGTANTVYRL